MAVGGHVYPTLKGLPELQERTLVDTGVQLEHRGGFALGMVEGTERLCLLCPECWISIAVVSAWIWCGHCGEPLTWLASRKQEPLYYNLDLHSGLCRVQPRKFQKTGEGLESPLKGVTESEPGDFPAKICDVREEESAVACDLVGNLATVSTAIQEPGFPEMLAGPVPIASPFWKEPVLRHGPAFRTLDMNGDWGEQFIEIRCLS